MVQQRKDQPDQIKPDSGPDLKKMKKSGSTKRSSAELPRSFPFGMRVPQPGKPPTIGDVRVPRAPTPPKQSQVRQGSDGVPNYMKPTSSSDARKDRSSSVSPPTTRLGSGSGSGSKTGSPKGSSSCSSKTHVKSPKRFSSSRLVRTLTKTLSFKHVRPLSAKRCSKVVLCANMNPQRATCSSTLKDSKFPKYLSLSPGATEAEGTSVMKVCPYTYCSLNGHRHALLPPLKRFITARRRAMKAQRNLSVEGLKADVTEEPTVINEPLAVKAEEGRGFFIELFAETEDNDMISLESPPEEKEPEVREQINLPISVTEESVEETGSESSVMEWDDHQYSSFEIVEAAEHSMGNENPSEDEKLEVCSDLYLIDWKGVTDEEMKPGEDQSCPETELPEDRVSEISETSQVSHCFNYDRYSSSSEEEEMEEVMADAEESVAAESKSAEAAESIITYPVLHEPSEDRDSQSDQHPCKEEEDTAADEVNEKDDNADEIARTAEAQDRLFDEQESRISDANKSRAFEISDEVDDEKMKIILMASEDSSVGEVNEEEEGIHTQSSAAEEAPVESNDATVEKSKSKYTRGERNSKPDPEPSENRIVKNKCKRPSEEENDPRGFNPRDPNYLPLVPDPEAEKVDLKHQMMDERRNSEEWMIDYALRQAVTRLAPARKRKVALLVEAFEKVVPIPKTRPNIPTKWETQYLTSPRPIQACS